MLAEESEPSLYDCNISSCSSSVFTDDEPNVNNNLERKTSLSLHDISSTAYVNALTSKKKKKSHYFRSASHQDVDAVPKPKRKKYAHVESKVKKYIEDIKKQQEDSRERRRREEQRLNADYERKYSLPEPQNEEIQVEKENNNLVEKAEGISDMHAYEQMLKKIEVLELEISKLKTDRSTPKLVRRKNLQSSMIKTCLFKNSSTVGLRPNPDNLISTPRYSIFGDSTCMTIDVEDIMSNESIRRDTDLQDRVLNTTRAEEDPFLIQSVSPNPSENSATNSEAPLIFDFCKPNYRSRNGILDFFYKIIKCPKIQCFNQRKSYTCNAMFKLRNRVTPVPKVVILSPKTTESNSDSGNQSDGRTFKNYLFQPNNRYNWDEWQCTPKQELILKQMTECAEELSNRLDVFKKLSNEYFIQKNKDVN